MKVFVVGASGAIGTYLVPQLISKGHEVFGSCRSSEKIDHLKKLGAKPVILDLLDRQSVIKTVLDIKPDAIIHQATHLSGMKEFKNLDKGFEITNRLRTEGTDSLLKAASEAGVQKFIAQSFANYRYARTGDSIKSETDLLDPEPIKAMIKTDSALKHLENEVTKAGGISLRYGGFYGKSNDDIINAVRKRKFPIVGNGNGVTSFIHLKDAAYATVLSLEHQGSAIYNIVDDEPTPLKEWLPYLADVLGVKPPYHIPGWIARIVAGKIPLMIATEARGASNTKAKKELGWTLKYPSWRVGFKASYN